MIIPISELKKQARPSELGRIRPGFSVEKPKKGGGTRMAPVDSRTWVLTAQTRDGLDKLAEDYGGEVEPWADDRTTDRWRLITDTEALHVVLPPKALSEPAYEKWERGFIRRRCDGVTCTGYPRDGSPPVDVPCICATVDDSRLHCKLKQHVGFILPQVPLGIWRLVTTSGNAARELIDSIEIIRLASQAGLPRAVLTRQDRVSGEKHYRVPVLTTAASFDQLEAAAAGRAPVLDRGAGTPPPLALPPGGVVEVDEVLAGGEPDSFGVPAIVEAELVDEDEDEGPTKGIPVEPVDELTEAERAVIDQMKAARPKPRRKATSGDAGDGDKPEGSEATVGASEPAGGSESLSDGQGTLIGEGK